MRALGDYKGAMLFYNYKTGEILLEELVLKYYREEVMEALERYFNGVCEDKGLDLDFPAFIQAHSLSGINEFFSEMVETFYKVVDNVLDNGIQSASSGMSSGSGTSIAKRKKKRRDDEDEGRSSGMHY